MSRLHVTTERTLKRYKLLKVLAFFVLLAGVVIWNVQGSGASPSATPLEAFEARKAGVLTVGASFAMYLFARVASWWSHG